MGRMIGIIGLLVIGTIQAVSGQGDSFCALFVGSSPILDVCQNGTATGGAIYLNSDSAPGRRVRCRCQFILTGPQGVYATPIHNDKEGVEYEIAGEVFRFNTQGQNKINVTNGSPIVFKKYIANAVPAPRMCMELLADRVVDSTAEITVSCSPDVEDLPSTLPPATTTTSKETTTSKLSTTTTTTTEAPTTTTQPSTTTTKPPTTTTQPVTTKPATQPVTTKPVTQPSSSTTTTADPVSTKPPTTIPSSTKPPTTTTPSPAPTTTLPATTDDGTTAAAGGEGTDDSYTSNDKTIGIIIIVALCLGILLVLIVLLCAVCGKDKSKKEKKEEYRVYKQPPQPNYYMTSNPDYESADVYAPDTQPVLEPGRMMVISDPSPPPPQPESYVSQEPMRIDQGGAEYTLVSFKRPQDETEPVHVVSYAGYENFGTPDPHADSVRVISYDGDEHGNTAVIRDVDPDTEPVHVRLSYEGSENRGYDHSDENGTPTPRQDADIVEAVTPFNVGETEGNTGDVSDEGEQSSPREDHSTTGEVTSTANTDQADVVSDLSGSGREIQQQEDGGVRVVLY